MLKLLGEREERTKNFAEADLQQNQTWSLILYVECSMNISISRILWHPLLMLVDFHPPYLFYFQSLSLKTFSLRGAHLYHLSWYQKLVIKSFAMLFQDLATNHACGNYAMLLFPFEHDLANVANNMTTDRRSHQNQGDTVRSVTVLDHG